VGRSVGHGAAEVGHTSHDHTCLTESVRVWGAVRVEVARDRTGRVLAAAAPSGTRTAGYARAGMKNGHHTLWLEAKIA